MLYRELVRLVNPSIDGEVAPEAKSDDITITCRDIARSISQVGAYLADVRPQYLAVSGNEKMRDDIDFEVSRVIQAEKRKVRELESLENDRFEKSQVSGLRKIISDPRVQKASETLHAHRQGIFVYLNTQLQQVSASQADAQHVRLARQVPLKESIGLSATPPLNENPSTLDEVKEEDASVPLDGEQLQLLAENDELMTELNETLERAKKAERSIRDVAELQAELSSHLESQTQTINLLASDVEQTASDVGGANEQLKRAQKRNKRASQLIVYGCVASGLLLLFFNH